jgi:hypothetical protein
MDEKMPYWGSVFLSAAALVLVCVNIALSNSNHNLQLDVSQRQATLVSGQQLVQLNQSLMQVLAEDAVKNNDTQIRDLLTSQGLSLKEPTAASAPATAAAPAKSPAKK